MLLMQVDITIVYYHLSNDAIQNFRVIHAIVLIWQQFVMSVFDVFRYNGKRVTSIRNSFLIFGWKNVRRNKNEVRCRLWELFTIYDNRQILVQRIPTWSFICFWWGAPKPPGRRGYWRNRWKSPRHNSRRSPKVHEVAETVDVSNDIQFCMIIWEWKKLSAQ